MIFMEITNYTSKNIHSKVWQKKDFCNGPAVCTLCSKVWSGVTSFLFNTIPSLLKTEKIKRKIEKQGSVKSKAN